MNLTLEATTQTIEHLFLAFCWLSMSMQLVFPRTLHGCMLTAGFLVAQTVIPEFTRMGQLFWVDSGWKKKSEVWLAHLTCSHDLSFVCLSRLCFSLSTAFVFGLKKIR
ncbi:hypothetical protein HS088_TW04G00544 [Tripterygium wilfordii]|uniref:Uncharacterized protein n=1 Tax=Tripterygium wilfordii TaxID=458696 RepID=A0A7J7DR52_TRIWF|nr:hypothetical protein HS088_TW04G00544 [Tripterygium wilfordii]